MNVNADVEMMMLSLMMMMLLMVMIMMGTTAMMVDDCLVRVLCLKPVTRI